MRSNQPDKFRNARHGEEDNHHAVPRPETRGQQVAHWISQVGSPPVMGLILSLLILTRLPGPKLWMWIGLYIGLTLVVPIGFLLWQLSRGQVTDLDVHFRQQRSRSFAITCLGFLLTYTVMAIGNAPAILLLVVGAGLLQWLTLYLITLRWKISVHAASITGTTLILVWGWGLVMTPVVIAIPLVAWSRVKLRRHTLAQVIAGAVLGGIAFYVALLLTPGLRAAGLFAY